MLTQVSLGTISPNTRIIELVCRSLDDADPLSQDIRLQGRIQNISDFTLDDVKCDITYYDDEGRFLGLDLSSFTDLDDLDPSETAPFDLKLNIPEDAVKGKINTHSKKVLQDIGVALKGYVDKKYKRRTMRSSQPLTALYFSNDFRMARASKAVTIHASRLTVRGG
jgi:hypothetical protein